MSSDIDTVTVLGAGSMGHGIAAVVALTEYKVELRDISKEYVQDGYEKFEWSVEKLSKSVSDDEATATLGRIDTLVDPKDTLANVDFGIEGGPEQSGTPWYQPTARFEKSAKHEGPAVDEE